MKQLLLALTFAFAWVSASALNYFVKVPPGTNACYIAGEMNNWQHQQMKKVDDTHFAIDLPNAKPTHKYKYSSGPSWGLCREDLRTGQCYEPQLHKKR